MTLFHIKNVALKFGLKHKTTKKELTDENVNILPQIFYMYHLMSVS